MKATDALLLGAMMSALDYPQHLKPVRVEVNAGTGSDIKNLNKCKRLPKPKQFQRKKKVKNPFQYSKNHTV